MSPKSCNACARDCYFPDITINNVIYTNGSIDRVYSENCSWCGNLLYANIKQVKEKNTEV